MPLRTVAVLGGAGVFGGRIAQELSGRPDLALRLVGRGTARGADAARRVRGEFVAADLRDGTALARAVEGCALVVHAAGPFRPDGHRVARACLAAGASCLDLADDRAFVTSIGTLDEEARRRGLAVVSGASTVPALSHALAADLARGLSAVDVLEIALSPGNRNPRGRATVASILGYAGRPVRVWEGGAWTVRRGWGEPRTLRFPEPVGVRRVHTCEVPDLDLFPPAFGAHTVRFAAGLELGLLNRALSALAALRAAGLAPGLPRLAGVMAALSRLLLPFGSTRGALGVWVQGRGTDGALVRRSAALVAERDGPAVACAPAILLAGDLLDGRFPRTGAMPCLGLLDPVALRAHLAARGVRWLRDEGC